MVVLLKCNIWYQIRNQEDTHFISLPSASKYFMEPMFNSLCQLYNSGGLFVYHFGYS